MSYFSHISAAIVDLKLGKSVILVDSESRENQGDLIFPAEVVTPEKIAFMLNFCRGMICVPISERRRKKLNLDLMVEDESNTEQTGVKFTVSVDAVGVVDFGISVSDKALTIEKIAGEKTMPSDLVRPGHMFPIVGHHSGLLGRQGHTEGVLSLMSLGGFVDAGVLCEILNEKGDVANRSELIKMAEFFKLKIVSIDDLISYVRK